MADHNKPTLSDTYTDVLGALDARLKDQAAAFDPAKVSPTNVPVNAVRWSSASKKWQIWTGTAWNDLAASYAINITGSAAKLTTARTIALSGGAIGTATAFNGAANISIPVTSLDASKLTGRVPNSSAPVATITGTGDLTGGGDLTTNRTIDLTAEAKANLGKAGGAVQSDGSVTMTGNLKIGTATFSSTGDITGTAWGGTLSAALAAKQTALGYTPVNKAGDSGIGPLSASKLTAVTLPSPTTQGTHIGWNEPAGSGVSRFVCNRGGGVGGFSFDVVNGENTAIIAYLKINSNGTVVASGAGELLGTSNFLPWYGSQGAGGVGTYGFLHRVDAAVSPGSTVGGGSLRWTSTEGTIGGAPAGTWRAMGQAAAPNKGTLYLRIA